MHGDCLGRSAAFLKLLSLQNHFSTEHLKGFYSQKDNLRNTVFKNTGDKAGSYQLGNTRLLARERKMPSY